MSSGSWNQGWGDYSWNASNKDVTDGIQPHGEETEGGKGALWACTVEHKGQTYIGKCTKTEAWFGLGGKEKYVTDNFRPLSNASDPLEAPTGEPVAKQDGYGQLWHAIAVTVHGRIPGKATYIRDGDSQCWYTYAGEEHQAHAFNYICSS